MDSQNHDHDGVMEVIMFKKLILFVALLGLTSTNSHAAANAGAAPAVPPGSAAHLPPATLIPGSTVKVSFTEEMTGTKDAIQKNKYVTDILRTLVAEPGSATDLVMGKRLLKQARSQGWFQWGLAGIGGLCGQVIDVPITCVTKIAEGLNWAGQKIGLTKRRLLCLTIITLLLLEYNCRALQGTPGTNDYLNALRHNINYYFTLLLRAPTIWLWDAVTAMPHFIKNFPTWARKETQKFWLGQGIWKPRQTREALEEQEKTLKAVARLLQKCRNLNKFPQNDPSTMGKISHAVSVVGDTAYNTRLTELLNPMNWFRAPGKAMYAAASIVKPFTGEEDLMRNLCGDVFSDGFDPEGYAQS